MDIFPSAKTLPPMIKPLLPVEIISPLACTLLCIIASVVIFPPAVTSEFSINFVTISAPAFRIPLFIPWIPRRKTICPAAINVAPSTTPSTIISPFASILNPVITFPFTCTLPSYIISPVVVLTSAGTSYVFDTKTLSPVSDTWPAISLYIFVLSSDKWILCPCFKVFTATFACFIGSPDTSIPGFPKSAGSNVASNAPSSIWLILSIWWKSTLPSSLMVGLNVFSTSKWYVIFASFPCIGKVAFAITKSVQNCLAFK